jgi:predicted flap endonuclease-1-like 5' DNA nuclease
MGLLQKLLSTLGLRESDAGRGSERRGETTVTVEHEPDVASESAVKGTDGAAAGTTASGSTGTVADTADDESGAAEPSEATSPAADADAAVEEAEPDTDESEAAGQDETTEGDETADAGDGDDDGETATESEADAGDAAGSDESPDVLNGIGPAYAERLSDAGVDSVADLATADAATLAEETGLGEGRIANWIEQAKEY